MEKQVKPIRPGQPKTEAAMKNVKIKTPQTHLVTVYSLNDPVRAELIKNMLHDHGIKAEIAGEHQAGFTGTLPVEIIVGEADVEAAAEFIKEHFPDS